VVSVAADGANGFLEEAFLRRVGHFALKGAQARAFGGEHVVRGLEAGFFAGKVGFGDGFGAGTKGLPRGADGGEAGEEGHEGDADDTNALEAGLGEGLLGFGVLVKVAPVQEPFSTPPEPKEPCCEAECLQYPCQAEASSATPGVFISGG